MTQMLISRHDTKPKVNTY